MKNRRLLILEVILILVTAVLLKLYPWTPEIKAARFIALYGEDEWAARAEGLSREEVGVFGPDSTSAPARELFRRCRDLERIESIGADTVLFRFPWADNPEKTLSVLYQGEGRIDPGAVFPVTADYPDEWTVQENTEDLLLITTSWRTFIRARKLNPRWYLVEEYYPT